MRMNEQGRKTLHYLLVSKPQLVFEDRLAVGQELNLIGKGVESIGQGVGESQMVHTRDEGGMGCDGKVRAAEGEGERENRLQKYGEMARVKLIGQKKIG